MEKARAFYGGVRGFEIEAPSDDRLRFLVGSTRIVLKRPLEGTPPGDSFSEYRVGLDHIVLSVPDRGVLEKVLGTLKTARISTQGIQIEPALNKEFVCFRDPDNIQWEFFVE